MLLLDLEEDIVLLLFSLLGIQEISVLRQVCAALHRLTCTKAVWLAQISILVSDGAHIPAYLSHYRELEAPSLEALARRLSRSAAKWAAGNLDPARTYPLFLAQSITWLRLVHGRWLFVASSHDRVSKIACWDISRVLRCSNEPIAEAYLPGQVKTAKLEVQEGAIVIALGLGPETRSTHLVSLRRAEENFWFVELAHVENSSHVLMLSGEYIGCAVLHQQNIPHVVRWTTGEIFDLPPPPGERDKPDQRSVPHLMLFWNENLVLVRESALELYDLPSQSRNIFAFKSSFPSPCIWEAHVLPRDVLGGLRLAILSSRGVEIITLDSAMTFEADCYRRTTLLPSHRTRTVEPEELAYEHPHVLVGSLPQPVGTRKEASEYRVWRGLRSRTDPALWAFPLIDFDEAVGLAILGNCFGELAVYDLCSGPLPGATLESIHLSWPEKVLARSVLPLSLPTPAGPTKHMSETEFQAATSHWAKDELSLDWNWSTDWFSQRFFAKAFMWNAAPGEMPWRIEHGYGFPGDAVPQAFTVNGYSDEGSAIIFRVGDRILIRNIDGEIGSWSHEVVAEGLDNDTEEVERPTCVTALVSSSAFLRALRKEGFMHGEEWYDAQNPRRNRYAEQRARGGSVRWDAFHFWKT